MNRRKKLLWGIAMMCLLAGCAENPDSSIIQNKDFDNMIEEAHDTEESVDMEGMSQDVEENYDTYVTTITDENLHVTVNVDAKVEIPTTDKLSVYRVKQADVSQEMLDRVRTTLAPDTILYDGAILETDTKETLEEEIQYYKNEIKAIDDGTSAIAPDNRDTYRQEYEMALQELEARYENAPVSIQFDGNESDYMIHTVDEMYAENSDSEYYIWQNNLTSEGDEVFYGVSDGKNGEYISLYVQNNDDYGNVIRYSRNKIGHSFASAVSVGGTDSSDMWKEGEKSIYMENNCELPLTDKEPLTISIEEARAKADMLMENLGLVDFQCSDEGLRNEIPDIRTVNYKDLTYRQVYLFEYLRTVDNTMVSNEAGSKHTEGWSGDEYVKKDWPGENIYILVNDSGIVGFYYNCPIEITEIVVEKSQLKTFDEVKSTFEEMVIIAHGTDDSELIKEEESYNKNIDIYNVVLRYARISEADNFDSGLLVPVWDFEGEIDDGYVWEKENVAESVLTINAIDGSIIDHTLGY